jgi:ribonuclease-3
MDPYTQLKEQLPQIERSLGYVFRNQNLILSAFVHRSFINEHKELELQHNERLEFLGDSVLNLLIAEFLYKELPDTSEGELSQLRAHLISSTSCISFINILGIEEYILVGRGEQINTGRGKHSIIADLFEAILGAIYLDSGLESVKYFFLEHLSERLKEMLKNPKLNFKAVLQEFVQKTKRSIPQYHVVKESGPDHEKQFEIGVYVEGEVVAAGYGSSKKEAEQDAAKKALIKLNPEAFTREDMNEK